jgi:hypothetical protein
MQGSKLTRSSALFDDTTVAPREAIESLPLWVLYADGQPLCVGLTYREAFQALASLRKVDCGGKVLRAKPDVARLTETSHLWN